MRLPPLVEGARISPAPSGVEGWVPRQGWVVCQAAAFDKTPLSTSLPRSRLEVSRKRQVLLFRLLLDVLREAREASITPHSAASAAVAERSSHARPSTEPGTRHFVSRALARPRRYVVRRGQR